MATLFLAMHCWRLWRARHIWKQGTAGLVHGVGTFSYQISIQIDILPEDPQSGTVGSAVRASAHCAWNHDLSVRYSSLLILPIVILMRCGASGIGVYAAEARFFFYRIYTTHPTYSFLLQISPARPSPWGNSQSKRRSGGGRWEETNKQIQMCQMCNIELESG